MHAIIYCFYIFALILYYCFNKFYFLQNNLNFMVKKKKKKSMLSPLELAEFCFKEFLKNYSWFTVVETSNLFILFYLFNFIFQSKVNLWISTEWKNRPVVVLWSNQKSQVIKYFHDKPSNTGLKFLGLGLSNVGKRQYSTTY